MISLFGRIRPLINATSIQLLIVSQWISITHFFGQIWNCAYVVINNCHDTIFSFFYLKLERDIYDNSKAFLDFLLNTGSA